MNVNINIAFKMENEKLPTKKVKNIDKIIEKEEDKESNITIVNKNAIKKKIL